MGKLERNYLKCLDTNFLVEVLRGNEKVKEKVNSLKEETNLSTTSITAFELYFGAEISQKKTGNTKEVEKLLNGLTVLNLDRESAKKAATIEAELTKKGTKIGLNDSFIAAIALQNNCIIITENKKHFQKIKGLKIE